MWRGLFLLFSATQCVHAANLPFNRLQTIKRQSQAPIDTTIDLPPDIASAVQAFFNDEDGTCSTSTSPSLRNREASPNDLAQYVLCVAKDSIDALAPNEPLSRFWDLVQGVDKSTILPVFKEPAYQKAMGEAVAYGGMYLPTARQGSTALVYGAAAWSMYRLAFVMVIQHQKSFLHSVIDQSYFVPGQQMKSCPVDTIECDNSLCSGHNGHCSSTSLYAQCTCQDWVCWGSDDILFCDECGGDSGGGKCKGIPEQQQKYKSCQCLSEDKTFIDTLGPSTPDELSDPPGNDQSDDTEQKKCNGVGSKTWVSSPAAEDAVVQFCANGVHAAGLSNSDLVNGRESRQQVYNAGTERAILLKWTFYGNMDVKPEECKNAWWEIVRGCDGNDPIHNPGNLKHGGTYSFRGGKDKGAILEFIPQSGKDQKICTPLTTDFWVDRDTLRSAAGGFCSLAASKDAGSSLHHETSNNPAPIKFSVDWEEGATRSNSECNRAFETVNVGCIGSNPDDYKRGGNFVIKGLGSFTATPLSNTQIHSGSGSGENDIGKYRRGDRAPDGTPIDKPALQKCLKNLQTSDFVTHVDCFHGIYMYLGANPSWVSASDCWVSCVNAVSQAIMDGYAVANCDAWKAGAHCWLGYTDQ